MINLVFDHQTLAAFQEDEMDVEHICNVLWDAGYAISEWDAYCAWLSYGCGVWEDPFDYEDADIVDTILRETCVVWEPKDPWLDEVTEEVTPVDEMEIMRKQFPFINAWAEAQDDYQPKVNAKPEGFTYDAADENSSYPPSKAW